MKWIDQKVTLESWRRLGCKSDPPKAAYVDEGRHWVVQVFPVPSCNGTPWEGAMRVGISHYRSNGRQREIRVNWSTIQGIKDDLWPDRLAIEVFPPHDQIDNVAPMRWLWILPPGSILPFRLEGDRVGK